MNKKFRSMVDELADYVPVKDRELFIESRGQQVIASALNLNRLIDECFDHDRASDLKKRLLRAIAYEDPEKFSRRVRSIREGKTRP